MSPCYEITEDGYSITDANGQKTQIDSSSSAELQANGRLSFNGNEYKKCKVQKQEVTPIEEITTEQVPVVNELKNPNNIQKKEKIKKVEQPKKVKEIDTTHIQMEENMGLPVLAPQDTTQGQGQVQPQQGQVQPQQVQPQQIPQGYPIQPQQVVQQGLQQIPQGYIPQGFTVPQQYQGQVQQFIPQQLHETHSSTEAPKDGMDMNMIKTILDIAGNNPVVLVALIGAYIAFTWMKKMEKIKEKEAENGGQHANTCDTDRKNISSKLGDVEFKIQRLDQLENKLKQMGDVHARLAKLEENSGGLNIGGDTEELEEKLDDVVKILEDQAKKISSLETKLKKEKAPTTRLSKNSSDSGDA
jgi:hypothetical protein